MPAPHACGFRSESAGLSDAGALQALIDHAGVLVLHLDAAGRLIGLNEAAERLTGWRLDDVRGKNWIETLVPADYREKMRSRCRPWATFDGAESHTIPILLRDGTVRFVDWFHSALRNEGGDRNGIVCIGRDVTELQQVREALLASEERSRGVLETAVNAIVTINEECIIETVNPATERIFGYTPSELIGRKVNILMPSPYRERHDSYVARYLQTGVRRIIGIGREAIGQRKDGALFPIDLSVGEVTLPGGRRVFTGIIRDLSERKELEQKILRISEEEQHRIGRDIHDDLCQQLAAIGCLAKVSHQHLARTGSQEADNLAEIVRLISSANMRAREMSRGLMPVMLDSAGLMDALDELANSTQRVFRVSCRFRCDHPVKILDNNVAIQLYRIAQEAVANAIKHSKADRIAITLALRGNSIVMSVKDNGIGIPDHSPHKGTGMGLLTMSHRARMMGGTLGVDHDESGGTIMRCQVPVPPPPPKSPPRRRQP